MNFNNIYNVKKLVCIIITAIICISIIAYKHYTLPNIKAYFESRKSIVSEKNIMTNENKAIEENKQEIDNIVEPEPEIEDFSNATKYSYTNEEVNNVYEAQKEEQQLNEKQLKKQEKRLAKENRRIEKQRLREVRKQQKTERRNKDNSENLSVENNVNTKE